MTAISKALFLLSLLCLAQSSAFAGPGEGGGPRPGTPTRPETMPEGTGVPEEDTDDMLHPRDVRTNQERDEVVGY